MENVQELWFKYHEYSNRLSGALGRTSNIVGEYAEHLLHKLYGGNLLRASQASSDIEGPDGVRYQVKSRKIKGNRTTQLNVIRSWDFDFLTVVLFDSDGRIKRALEVPVTVAKEFAVANRHQNGWVISTTQAFLGDKRCKDLTEPLTRMFAEK